MFRLFNCQMRRDNCGLCWHNCAAKWHGRVQICRASQFCFLLCVNQKGRQPLDYSNEWPSSQTLQWMQWTGSKAASLCPPYRLPQSRQIRPNTTIPPVIISPPYLNTIIKIFLKMSDQPLQIVTYGILTVRATWPRPRAPVRFWCSMILVILRPHCPYSPLHPNWPPFLTANYKHWMREWAWKLQKKMELV